VGSESLQHKLSRVRRPRVQISYDVETGGAMRRVELPFVVGVLSDLGGMPKEAPKPLKERGWPSASRTA
jgi:type VI secretion system protein ImpB